MRFSFGLLSSALLATTTLASPQSKRGLERRLGRRAGRTLQGTTKLSKQSTKSNAATGNSSIEYSNNWSGMAITSPPSGQTFNSVSAKITVPTVSAPSNTASTNGDYAASAWVGIDGDTYSNAILQTGLDFTVSTSGAVSYTAWYEWYPATATNFDLTISAGDVRFSPKPPTPLANISTGHLHGRQCFE